MRKTKHFTSGIVAKMLGFENRDKLSNAFIAGCPSPEVILNRRIYTVEDVEAIYDWFVSHGRKVTRPAVLDEQPHAATA